MILLYKGVREKKYVSICCYAHTHAHSHIAHISTSCQPALSTSCRKRETSFPLVCTCYLLVDNTLFTRKCPCLVYVFRSCWSRRRRRRPGREGAAWSPCVSVTWPDYPRTFSTIIITLLVCTYIKFHTMPYRCSAWMADRFVALLMSDRSRKQEGVSPSKVGRISGNEPRLDFIHENELIACHAACVGGTHTTAPPKVLHHGVFWKAFDE